MFFSRKTTTSVYVGVILFAIATLRTYPSTAQIATRIGGDQADHGAAIAVDDAGNIFIAGTFRQTVDFDFGAGTHELSAFATDSYVASYTPEGELRFAFPIDGASNIVPERGITVDDSGNVHVTGSFTGEIDFDPGPAQAIRDSNEGRIFVASYSNSGEYLSAIHFGGGISNLLEGGAAIATAAGTVYVTGTFNGSDDFDPAIDGEEFTAKGNIDAFIAAFSLDNSAFKFAIPLGGNTSDKGYGIAADTIGNVFAVGAFADTMDVDPSENEFQLISNGDDDIYVVSYTPLGLLRFGFNIGGNTESAIDRGYAVAVDSTGNFYVTGVLGGLGTSGVTADFDPGPGEHLVTPAGNGDIFLASYTNSGDLRYAFAIGDTDPDVGRGIVVAPDNSVHITGAFEGQADFDPDVGSAIIGANSNHAFVASYSGPGEFQNAYYYETPTGGNSNQTGNGIAFGSTGVPHVIGTFSNTVDFDPTPGLAEFTSAGGDDIFLTNIAASLVSIDETPIVATSLSLDQPFPNPATTRTRLRLVSDKTQVVKAELVDLLGRRLMVLADEQVAAATPYDIDVDASSLPSGVYIVRATSESESAHQLIVVQ